MKEGSRGGGVVVCRRGRRICVGSVGLYYMIFLCSLHISGTRGLIITTVIQ